MKIKLLILLSLTAVVQAQAGSATWNLNPTSGDWNTAANWTPATVPNGPSDVATFAVSNTTGISLSTKTTVSSVIFNAGASAFSITNPGLSFTIDGPGVINNSGVIQNFICSAFDPQAGLISFTGNASAGSGSVYTSDPSPGSHNSSISFFNNTSAGSASFVANGSTRLDATGFVDFYDTSTAANGAFTVNGSTSGSGAGGTVFFHEQSNAGSATFTTFGGVNSGGGGGNGGAVHFADTASAADCTITNNATLPGGTTAGVTTFGVGATAGNATITNKGAMPGENFGGLTEFFDNATAGNATFINEGGGGDFLGNGDTLFIGGNGGNATFINNGGATSLADGGTTEFNVGANAGNSTLIANSAIHKGSINGGQIVFSGDSDGGAARIILSGNGKLFLSFHDDASPITVGSIEGDGRVLLGYRDLIVGSNNLNTTFSGGIGSGGGDGTVTKIGRGTWTLTGSSAYSAGTFVNGGRLVINNPTGSATGTSPVQVNKGSLAGRGIVAGAVTVGSGTNRQADVSPGGRAERNVGTLTILSTLAFNSDGNYTFQVNSDSGVADSLTVTGATIESGAQFNATDLGTSALSIGGSFVALNNTSGTPISGAFSNLPDGSTVTIGSNTFQASYEGGDGNDLTLTVVLNLNPTQKTDL